MDRFKQRLLVRILTPVPESPAFQSGDEWKSFWGFWYGVSDLKLKKPRTLVRGVLTSRTFEVSLRVWREIFKLVLSRLNRDRAIKFFVNSVTSLLLVIALSNPAYADIDIVISNNGAGSTNSVSVTSSEETSVTQSNSNNTTSEVSNSANTGDNSASQNTGNTTEINTGDISQNTTINNEVNHSEILYSNSESSTDVSIAGNGADSQNSVLVNSSNSQGIYVSQTANVLNNVSNTANSGQNSANNNTGNLTQIFTGMIFSNTKIQNGVNTTKFIFDPLSTNLSAFIQNNGADSQNILMLDFINSFIFNKFDFAEINSNLLSDLNTGRNNANGNLANVLIGTGSINASLTLINGPINNNLFVMGILPEPPGNGNPPPDENPPRPPSPGNLPDDPGSKRKDNGLGGNGALAENILGMVGSVLPATGMSALHFWYLAVIYLLMFLFGIYLRLRAGRSPTRRQL